MTTHVWSAIQVFLTPEYLAIAMEYAAGGDMFQLVVRQRGLPESDARWFFQQLIIAIDYCHRMVRPHTLHVCVPVTDRTREAASHATSLVSASLSVLLSYHVSKHHCLVACYLNGHVHSAGCCKQRYKTREHSAG